MCLVKNQKYTYLIIIVSLYMNNICSQHQNRYFLYISTFFSCSISTKDVKCWLNHKFCLFFGQRKKSWIKDMRKDDKENIGCNRFSPCWTGWNAYEFIHMQRYQGGHNRSWDIFRYQCIWDNLSKLSNLGNAGNVLNGEEGRGNNI